MWHNYRMAAIESLDNFLQVDTGRFTAPMANAMIHFTVSDEVKERAEELAEKSNFGTITEQERAEYQRLIEWAEMLSLMKARAKRFLETKS